MKALIAQAASNQPNQPNQSNIPASSLEVAGGGVAIAVFSALLTKFVPWGEISKQLVGAKTSSELMKQNRLNQEIEGEIDINQGLSNTLSGIAKDTVNTAMDLLKESVGASQLHVQASIATNKATQDLTDATKHLIDAFNALTLAQSRSQKSVEDQLRKVSESQEITQEYLANISVSGNQKNEIILDKLDEVLKRVTEVRNEILSAIASVK